MLRTIHPQDETGLDQISKSFRCNYTRIFSSEVESNWVLAIASYIFVTRHCVYGASNRKEDAIKTGFFVNKLLRNAREKNFGTTPTYKIKFGAMNALNCRAGNCAEQTSLAIIYLLSRGCNQLHKIRMVNGDHNFLSIGLKDSSDLKNQSNIPDEAIIVDLWKKNVYLATEYLNKVNQDKLYDLKDIPEIEWSFERDGLWLENTNTNMLSNLMKEFINEHMSIPESFLRNEGLISGIRHKPQKKDHELLLNDIKNQKKGSVFFKHTTNKNFSLVRTGTYADNGLQYLIEELADRLLGEYFLHEIPLKNLTYTSLIPINKIPNFKAISLKELLFNFREKFLRISNNYQLISQLQNPLSADELFYHYTKIVHALDDYISKRPIITLR